MRILFLSIFACQEETEAVESSHEESPSQEENQTEEEEEIEDCELPDYSPSPFISEVVSISYGEGAGFGQEAFPNIVFGAPEGRGDNAGSLDVLSLGAGGEIIVSFDEMDIVNEEGVDFIIFENPFIGWMELGIVSASQDGENWVEWSCNLESLDGCAGVFPVYSSSATCIDARDPTFAGGDGFDLADIDLEWASYIKIVDADVSGLGGFDLDSIAIVNGEVIED